MKNLINAIDLQQEKLNALRHILRRIESDNQYQSTRGMLIDLQEAIEEIILTDF
jgi:hypothetical protein